MRAPRVATADPVADPAATVVEGHARFTMLTPRLVRMEWSADGHFERRASLVFIHRRLAVPHHTVRRAGSWLTVQTDDLTLRYRRGGGRFRPGNLEVRLRVDGRDVVWRPGESDSANLKGTTRTLDGAKGPVPLEPGLLSRAGWTVLDDSQRPLFDQSPWPWVVARPAGERQDLYFFGYGHDYKGGAGRLHQGGRSGWCRCRHVSRSASGGRATGPTPTRNSRTSSASSTGSTCRSTCS